MHRIAYIEPCDSLLHHVVRTPYQVLNILLHSRIQGIEQAILEFPGLDIDWINNSLSIKQFIKSKEHLAYDAVLLTAPDEKAKKLIAQLDPEEDTVFAVSDDSDPGTGFNYIGPDIEKDIHTVLKAVTQEGVKQLRFIAAYDKPRTINHIKGFRKIMPEYGLSFNSADIIGLDLKKKKPFFASNQGKEKRRFFTKEIINFKDDTDLFIFLDEADFMSVYIRLTTIHNMRIPEDIRLFSMRACGEFPEPFYSVISRFGHVKQDYQSIGRQSIKTIWEILEGKRPRNNNKILVPGLFTPGISISNPQDRERDEALVFKANIAHYLSRHYMEDVSGAKIAGDLDLNYSYFLTKFRNTFGEGLKTYINKIRLEKAANLIASTDRNLAAIYKDVGYTNASTFDRQFKKRFGKKPSEYRKSARKQ